MDQHPLRVIYVVNARLPGGGVGNVAYYAALALQQHGYLQRLIASSLRDTSFDASPASTLGIVGRGLKRLTIYDPTDTLYRIDDSLFDRFAARHVTACDIVHGWLLHSYYAKAKAKRLGAITVLQSGSTHPLTQRQLLTEEYRRWGLTLRYPLRHHTLNEIEQADYVVIPSPCARDSFIEHGVPPDRVFEHPFGVDTDRFNPRLSERNDGIFRIIFVGQVTIRKGIFDLLDAWQRLRWRNAKLVVIGRADPDTQHLLKMRHLPEHVQWLTHSTELWRWYHASDVFVFPSIEEGSALVTYEAMACGLPIITTYNAGSVARDGQDGFIVPIRDVDALCDRLQQLRDDTDLRVQLGRSARARVEEFSWPHYQARLIDIYHRITSPKSAGPL